MATFEIIGCGDDIWPDLKGDNFTFVGEGAKPIQVAVIPEGLRHRVHLRIDIPGEKSIVVETSLRLFIGAADILESRFGAQ